MTWRPTLRELVASGAYRTQGALVRALAEAGHPVDQGAVSRELRLLGARKIDGIYRLPSNLSAVPVHRMAETAGGCLAVLHTDPAFANVLAQAIDDAELSGVLGTIAGDDTVFVATTGARATAALAQWVGISLSNADNRRNDRR